ncbi:TIGR02270 family protein [Hyalangium rubrum]|uniref:TIGR02270 family protein n=1 Tax=Hyalangium rubrum TaxID=3103134 RepID=A0ABU5HCE0_9BACT|nr:TIGR02270 family protein [Hyalangium sp. s54d21]MDY7230926.1 TIGR02270 family protein [Hyalangium sp. s54d21]
MRPIRWDIYEEHLEEAAFRWSQRERALDSPDDALEEVAELEAHMSSHLDALILGGEHVARQLLEPGMNADDAERVVASTLALLSGEKPHGPTAVLAMLRQAKPPVLALLLRALELADPLIIAADLSSLLKQGDSVPGLLALVIETLGTHGFATAALCKPFLTHPEPQVAAAALHATSRMRLPLDPNVLQRALDSTEWVLRDAAIVAGLMSAHRSAWTACKAELEAPRLNCRLPLLLVAMGGTERDTERLIALLSNEELRPNVLWALGFTGSIIAAEACLTVMRNKPVAALAAEAFSAITGLRIEGNYAAERLDLEEEELTPLEQEDALPRPRVDAVTEWWQQVRPRMDARKRYLAGQPLTAQVLLDALARTPMRRRHALALALALRSRGTFQLPTRALVKRQIAIWQQARAITPSILSQSFAEGLHG